MTAASFERISEPVELDPSITQALQLARDDSDRAGATGFLRRAAQSLADTGGGDAPESAGESIDDEMRALSDLLDRKHRWLSADEVLGHLSPALGERAWRGIPRDLPPSDIDHFSRP